MSEVASVATNDFENLRVGIMTGDDFATQAWGTALQGAGVGELLWFDPRPGAAQAAVAGFGGTACRWIEELVDQNPAGVVVALAGGEGMGAALRSLLCADVLVEPSVARGVAEAVVLDRTARMRGKTVRAAFLQPVILESARRLFGMGDVGELATIGCTWRRRDGGRELLEEVIEHAAALLGAVPGVEPFRVATAVWSEEDHGWLVQLDADGHVARIVLAEDASLEHDVELTLQFAGELGEVEVDLPTSGAAGPDGLGQRLHASGNFGTSGGTLASEVVTLDWARATLTRSWLASLGAPPVVDADFLQTYAVGWAVRTAASADGRPIAIPRFGGDPVAPDFTA